MLKKYKQIYKRDSKYRYKMKFVTWNIGGGYIFSEDPTKFDTEDINYFIEELRHLKPDVICLQEAHTSNLQNQPQFIANALGLQYVQSNVVDHSHIKEGEKLTISILSKFPLIKQRYVQVTNPNLESEYKGKICKSHNKGFLETFADYKNNSIRIITGHMNPFHIFNRDFMEDEFKIIRDEIKDMIYINQETPMIFGGDINHKNMIQLVPKLETTHQVILNDLPTIPKGSALDKIIASKEWSFSNLQITKGKADHYMCSVELELKN